jgi:hypothetical protein
MPLAAHLCCLVAYDEYSAGVDSRVKVDAAGCRRGLTRGNPLRVLCAIPSKKQLPHVMDGLGVPARVEHVLLLPCAPMFERELPSRQLEAHQQPASENLTFRNFFTLPSKPSTLAVTRHQWPPPPTVDCIFASEFSNTLRLRPSKVFSKAAILHNQRQQRQSCALLLLSATNHPHTPDAQRQPVNRPSRHLLWALEDYTRAASCRRQHAQAPADTKAAVT